MSAVTVDDVVMQMQALAQSFGSGDGVAAFNAVYLTTTQAVRERIGSGFFIDDAFMQQLDLVFAGRYFAAVKAGGAGVATVPPAAVGAAWRPLFEQRHDERVCGLQFVVAGMNAHINHDLAIALVDTCTAAGVDPGSDRVATDYRRINDVLAQIEARVRASMLTDLERELGRPAEPLVHLLGTWSIERARDAAWVRALMLWHVRGTPWLAREAVEVSAAATGMTGRHLLTPLAF